MCHLCYHLSNNVTFSRNCTYILVYLNWFITFLNILLAEKIAQLKLPMRLIEPRSFGVVINCSPFGIDCGSDGRAVARGPLLVTLYAEHVFVCFLLLTVKNYG